MKEIDYPFSSLNNEIEFQGAKKYFDQISSDLKYIPIYEEIYRRNEGDEFHYDIYSFEIGYVNSRKTKKSFLMFHDSYLNEGAPGNSRYSQEIIKKFQNIKKKEFNEFPKFIYENYEKFSNNSSRYDSPDLLNEVRLNKTFKWDIKKIERLTKEKLKNNKKVYNFYLKKGFEYILNESGGFDASFLITIVEFSKNLNEYGNQKIIKILNPLTKVEKLKFEKQLKQRFNKDYLL